MNVLDTPPPQAQLDQLARQDALVGAATVSTASASLRVPAWFWLIGAALAFQFVFRNVRKNRVRGSTRTYRY